MNKLIATSLLALMLTACGAIPSSEQLIMNVAPLTNRSLDTVLQETWDTRLPCSWPARAWVERAATVPGEGQRFSIKCDPYNFLEMTGKNPTNVSVP